MERLKKILIYGGWFGSKNVGDEAILLGILKNLKALMPEATFTVFSGDPNFTEKFFHVTAINANNIFTKVFLAYQKADLFVVSGGTPFYDYDHLLRFYRIGLAKALGKPIIFYGVSIKEIKSRIGKLTTRFLVNIADVLTVREPGSEKILRNLGITREVILTADPTIMLEPAPPEHVAKIYTLEGVKLDSTTIGIAPRYFSTDYKYVYHDAVSQQDIYKYITVMAQVADHFIDKGYKVIFIPFHSIPPDDDKKIIAKIVSLMRRRDNVFIIKGTYTPSELIGMIGKLRLVIGTRLHSLIFSTLMYVPIVAISYERKIKDFMELIGQNAFVCELENLQTKALVHKVEMALSSEKITSELRDKIQALRLKALLTPRLIVKLLNAKKEKSKFKSGLRVLLGMSFIITFGSILMFRSLPSRIYTMIIHKLNISQKRAL